MLALTVLSLGWLLFVVLKGVRALRTRVPGPWYNNFTSVVLKYHEFGKNRRLWIHELHRRYGAVVRLSPDEVSFANVDGMKEIYQSGGSGYDKTEFYDLFKQYDHRYARMGPGWTWVGADVEQDNVLDPQPARPLAAEEAVCGKVCHDQRHQFRHCSRL